MKNNRKGVLAMVFTIILVAPLPVFGETMLKTTIEGSLKQNTTTEDKLSNTIRKTQKNENKDTMPLADGTIEVSTLDAFKKAFNNEEAAEIIFKPTEPIVLDTTITIPENKAVTIDGSNRETCTITTKDGVNSFFIIEGKLTLQNITLDGQRKERHQAILYNNGGTLIVNHTTIKGGNTTATQSGGIYSTYGTVNINNSKISGNMAYNGGGIYFDDSTVTIEYSEISGNTAYNGGGIYLFEGTTIDVNHSKISDNIAYNGGGIFSGSIPYNGNNMFSGKNTMHIDNSEISGNTAYDGGGIDSDTDTINIKHSNILNNTAKSNGGGIYAYESTITIDASKILDNTALKGGGMDSKYSTIDISNRTTLSGNTARSSGGGLDASGSILTIDSLCEISNNISRTGGGICFYDSMVTIDRVKISDNIATDDGGGMDLYNSTVHINNSKILNNTAANGGGIYADYNTININNATFSHNTAENGGGIYCHANTSTVSNAENQTQIHSSTFSNNSAANGSGIYFQASLCMNTLELLDDTALHGDTLALQLGEGYGINNTVVIGIDTLQDSNGNPIDLANHPDALTIQNDEGKSLAFEVNPSMNTVILKESVAPSKSTYTHNDATFDS